MIKIENVSTAGWEAAIRGARNPMNSWGKSDTVFEDFYNDYEDCYGYHDVMMNRYFSDVTPLSGEAREAFGNDTFYIGPNDLKLLSNLAKAGSDEAKFRRMIVVYVDITAPIYLWQEIDTYKVGTVRNSCSFMHKGVSSPFSIYDFSLKNELIYETLGGYELKKYSLTYPYETDEYRIYTAENSRTYRVYRNGYVVREEFEYTDNYGSGRTRIIPEAPATLYQTKTGYFVVKFSGRNEGHIMLHRMVAEVWCEKPEGATQVNHIDGDKGNNCVENLEWVTPKENVEKAIETGLYDNLKSLHKRYVAWKHSSIVVPASRRAEFKQDILNKLPLPELKKKYGMTTNQVNNSRWTMTHSENEDLFQECYVWERLIWMLNGLRELYLETKDNKIFQQIRCLLPQGYLQRATLMLNYEVLANMYHARKFHRLDEWHDFCAWIESLPYAEELIVDAGHEDTEDQLRARFKSYENRIEYLEITMAKELYSRGMSTLDISEKIGIGESTIIKIVEENKS